MAENDILEQFEKLDTKYKKAIILRSRGFNMRQISEDDEVNASYSLVRNWFCEGGILHEIYEAYNKRVSDEMEKSFDSFIRQIKEDAVIALRTLVEIMTSKIVGSKERQMLNKNRIDAAKDILDRVVGKMQNIDLTSKGEKISINTLSNEELLKQALELGIDVNKLLPVKDTTVS